MLLSNVLGCKSTEEFKEGEEDKDLIYEQIAKAVEEFNENSNLYIELLTFASEIEYASHFDVEQIRKTPTDEQMEGGFDIIAIQGMGAVRPFPWSSGGFHLLQYFSLIYS